MIQVDSREKAHAIQAILEEFRRQKSEYVISKLYVGDYMNFDNPRLVIDRKQNLSELCSNVCQQHTRFRAELQRATEAGIQVLFLVEHGHGIRSLADVVFWENPRRHQRVREPDGRWKTVETRAMKGETLYKILCTMEEKYGCRFLFCEKKETGRRILELLGGKADDKRRNQSPIPHG